MQVYQCFQCFGDSKTFVKEVIGLQAAIAWACSEQSTSYKWRDYQLAVV